MVYPDSKELLDAARAVRWRTDEFPTFGMKALGR